jgi:hypothetical protein
MMLHNFIFCWCVLLYFIVWVEVIKIQIWFEFKLVCNLQKGLKIKTEFSNFLEHFGPNPSSAQLAFSHMWLTWPSQLAPGPASLPGFSLARSAPLTRTAIAPTINPLLSSSPNQPNFLEIFTIQSRLGERIIRTVSPLWVGTKSPIYIVPVLRRILIHK